MEEQTLVSVTINSVLLLICPLEPWGGRRKGYLVTPVGEVGAKA